MAANLRVGSIVMWNHRGGSASGKIVCINGKLQKSVTATKPVCPRGFKKK